MAESNVPEVVQGAMDDNEDILAEAAQQLRPDFLWKKRTAEDRAAYDKQRELTGPKQGIHKLDRSLPVGIGEGFRQTYDWKDEQARRMFRLDQYTSDNDDARSPSMDSTEALYRSTEYLNHALQQTQMLDPELAWELQLADRFLILYPELAVVTRNHLGFAGITEQLTAELMDLNSIDDLAQKASESYLLQSDIGDQFYTTFGNTMDPDTKNMLVVSLAGLSEKEQKRMFGLSAAYLDARPLITQEDQVEFSNWIAREASAIYDVENDQSFWGQIGRIGAHVFTNPADWIQDEVLGSLWTSASDGADAWYRQELQLEETIAISMGYEPGTDGWATFTGLSGALIDVVIDPTNIAFAGLGAIKAIKTAAYFDDALRGTNRFRAVARQFVPFRSRKAAIAIGLPTGVRGRSSRIAWTLFAKDHDGLMRTAQKNGVFKFILEANSPAAIMEKIPQLRKTDPGIVEMLMRQTDEESLMELYSVALKGSLLDPQSMAHTQILANEIDSAVDLRRVLLDADPQAFSAGDIASVKGGGVFHNMPFSVGDDAAKGTVDLTPLKATFNQPDAMGGVAKFDEITSTATLERAVKFVDTGVEASHTGTLGLKGGKTAQYTSGITEGGEKWTIVKDAEGATIGARIGDTVGVPEASRRQGVYTAMLQQQKDELGLTLSELREAGKSSLTQVAADAQNKVFGATDEVIAAAAKNIGNQADPLANGVVSYIRKGDTKVVTLEEGSKEFAAAARWVKKNTKYAADGLRPDGSIRVDAMRAYMRAENIDVTVINGKALFLNLEEMQAAGKIEKFAGGRAANSGLQDSANKLRIAKYERRMIAPKGDVVSKWVISDMPTKIVGEHAYLQGFHPTDYFFWRKAFGVFEGKKWSKASFLKRHLRGLNASIFLDDMPANIATGFANRQDGVQDITRMLTQMGADPALVRRSIDTYLESPTQATVLKIIQDGADDLGDPEITLGLWHFARKQGDELEYATINGGEQLTSGVRIDGGRALQPLMPSQTRAFVQLPEQRAFSAHVRRVKRSQARTFKMRNRGWGKTKNNRLQIMEDFGNNLPEGSEQAAIWKGMSLDEQFASAYAMVRDPATKLGDGLGYAAKFGQYFGEKWGRLRNAFSVSMLAWRPIGWMGNEMLDNTWRASMADGLSFFTRPFESVKAIYASRMIDRAIVQRQAYQVATSGVEKLLKLEAPSASVLLDRIAEVIPEIRKFVDVADDPIKQATAIRKFLNTELITNTDAIKVLDDPLAVALRRQRKGYEAAQRYDLPMNQHGELFDPNWDDVGLTGMETAFTGQIGAASSRHEWALGVHKSPELLEDYATAIGNVWARDMRDPAIRMYLEQLAGVRNGGEDGALAARRFVNSGSWNTMEEPIRNMARFDNMPVESMSDLELSAWYMKNKIGPYVDDVFGDALEVSGNAQSMRHGKFQVEIKGTIHAVDVDDPESVRKLVMAANGTDYVLPQSVVGVFTPRGAFGYGKATDGWKTPLKSYNQWALRTFGKTLPEKLQRQPAYLSAFKRFKNNYVRLGMTEDGANFVASQKAMEHINQTFFFVEAQTPFLKKMNDIFPFFAAQYEIIKAWTWNIPAANGAYGIGHARMLRAFDHVFTSFRENGLLQPRYDRDGKVEGWNLQFAQDPHTDNLAGQLVSKAGHLAMMAPAIMVEQIAEVMLQTDLDLTTDEVNFKFNHPFEFLGRGGGVLPTGRLQMGLNPAMGRPVSAIVDALPFTSTSNASIVEKDSNLELWIAEAGITDKSEFLTANKHALLDSGTVTEEELLRLHSGTLGFSTIKLPKGIELMLPGTTLAGDWIKNILFPYGQTDSLEEIVSDFTPRVVANMAKALGLWLNDGEEGATMWLPGILMGPTGRAGMGVARNDALIMLEMQNHVLTDMAELAEELQTLEEGTEKWIEKKDEMDRLDDFITKEVKEIAASRAFVQTIYSVLMPFNPKMPTESQTLRQYYHRGRNIAQQWQEGNPVPMPFDGDNARDAWNLVAAWVQDETGSQAKLEFMNQHGGKSSILAAISPRTYWGGTGLPVWDMDKYFDQVESGAIVPLPLDVLSYKIRSSQIQIEREMVFIEEYGNDPMKQAQAMIEDGARLDAISELFNNKWKALEMEDQLINDGAWAEYSAKHPENYVDIAYNEQLEKIEALDIAMQEIELDLYPTDPQEARRMQQKLQGIRNTLYDMVNVYNDGRYADWAVSPRQIILNEYWDAWGDYSDLLQEQYAKVADANTSEELSIAYDSIAVWRKENERPIRIDGVNFAAPSERSWNAMDKEHKTSLVDAKLDGKLEWLSYGDIDHIIEIYPQAEVFMPMSEEARLIMQWKSDQDALLARKFRIGGEFIDLEEGTGKYRTRNRDAIQEEFERRLRAAGEFGVLENMNNYPIENMANYGAVPQSMEFLVPYGVAIHRQLLSQDKSALSNAGKVLQRQFFNLVMQEFEAKPALRDDFITWGMRVFQESTIEGIVAQLLGNYKGDLE